MRPGVVYVGRIPHGFYEQEMRKYFSQFGMVKRLRLARSKKVTNPPPPLPFLPPCRKVTQLIIVIVCPVASYLHVSM